MKRNLRTLLERPEEEQPKLFIDMNQLDLIASAGMRADLSHHKTAHVSAMWKMEKNSVSIPLGKVDCSVYRYVKFALYSAGAEGFQFNIRLLDADGNGFEDTLTIGCEGWNEFFVPLNIMSCVGNSHGWDKIDCVVLNSACNEKDRKNAVVYLDSFYLYTKPTVPFYVNQPELKGAVVVSLGSKYTISDRQRVPNAVDESSPATPYMEKGAVWVPFGPVSIGFAHGPIMNNKNGTLTFTYYRCKYVFTAGEKKYIAGSNEVEIPFAPVIRGGTLFVPADFAQTFFHWRQVFFDKKTGVLIFSNRKNIYRSGKDDAILFRLAEALCLDYPTINTMVEDFRHRVLNPSRGRLFLMPDEMVNLRRTVAEDKNYATYLAEFKKNNPLDIDDQSISMFQEETDIEIVANYALLYRITGLKIYSQKAAEFIERFLDDEIWDTSFYKTAKIGYYISIVYDWCHQGWTEARKARFERAMLRHILRPSLEIFAGIQNKWPTACASCVEMDVYLMAATITFYNVYPETSMRLLENIMMDYATILPCLFPEGNSKKGLLDYSRIQKHIYLFTAMLENAFGTDYGYASLPGFTNAAYVGIYAETNNGIWKEKEETFLNDEMAYYATKKSGDKTFAFMRRRAILTGKKKLSLYDMLWYIPVGEKDLPQLPLDTIYPKVGDALFRSSFDGEATFLGLHVGRGKSAGKSGGIVLEMGGERFLSLPLGEFDDLLATEDGKIAPGAEGRFISCRSKREKAFAISDITSYNPKFQKANRGMMLTANRQVAVIQDEYLVSEPTTITIRFITEANVMITSAGKTAKLTQNGKSVVMRLYGTKKEVLETKIKDGYTILSVTMPIKKNLRFCVAFRRVTNGMSLRDSFYDVVPLSDWAKDMIAKSN